MEMGMEGCPSA